MRLARQLTPAFTALIKGTEQNLPPARKFKLSAAEAYASGGELDKAVGMLEEMAGLGVKVNDITVSVLVDALVKDRQMDRYVSLEGQAAPWFCLWT
eukprot:scaffold23941_cov21-Prasinocladus_malaysianus.AAC.1